MRYDINIIQKLFPNWYDKDFPMSYDDQKWIWENIDLSEEDEKKYYELLNTKERVSVKGRVNDTYKLFVNSKLFVCKKNIIAELIKCTSKTSPILVANLLEGILGPNHINGNWLYVAQHWTPRAIVRTIILMQKQHSRGFATINNPAGFFISSIRFRKKRKIFRDKSKSNEENKVI